MLRNYENQACLITGHWMICLKIFNLAAMNKFKNFVEWNAFGVCTAIGHQAGYCYQQDPAIFYVYFTPDDGFSYYHLHGAWLFGEICGSISGRQKEIPGIICKK